MPFDLTNGYQPRTFDEILETMVDSVNDMFGTTYDVESIVGTEFYKFFYAGIQEVMKSESYIAEITAKMTDYIRTANENIALPKSTIDGFINGLFADLGLKSTIKPITDESEAGNLFLCVDADDGENATGNVTITNFAHLTDSGNDTIKVGATTFTAQTGSVTPGAATFQAASSNNATATSLAAQINAHAVAELEVIAVANGAVVEITARHGGVAGNSIALVYNNVANGVGATVSGSTLTGGVDNEDYEDQKDGIIERMHKWLSGGLYYHGYETGDFTADNGQVFSYAYALPDLVDILVKITVTKSDNAKTPILNQNQVRDIFNANFEELYQIGLNFEPEKYLEIARDLPFASNILLEYSENGGSTYISTPKSLAFNQKINITAPATVIIS
jgi:hypothetical protein